MMGVRLYNPIRGAFTSVDPVRGGNITAYTYPVDPVNTFDISGEWCVAGVGTTCTRIVKLADGRALPVSSGARAKLAGHNIRWNTFKWMILKAKLIKRVGTRQELRYIAKQFVCVNHKCKPTGEKIVLWFIIDFRTMQNGKTKGLVTGYCVMPGKGKTCPNWINRIVS